MCRVGFFWRSHWLLLKGRERADLTGHHHTIWLWFTLITTKLCGGPSTSKQSTSQARENILSILKTQACSRETAITESIPSFTVTGYFAAAIHESTRLWCIIQSAEKITVCNSRPPSRPVWHRDQKVHLNTHLFPDLSHTSQHIFQPLSAGICYRTANTDTTKNQYSFFRAVSHKDLVTHLQLTYTWFNYAHIY